MTNQLDAAVDYLERARFVLSILKHPLARSLSLDIGQLKGEQKRESNE